MPWDLSPIGHVIVLATPAPERVGEAVHRAELLGGHGGYTAENCTIRQLEAKGVHGDGHVPRLIRTGVQVPVVHRQQIHIVEHHAVPVFLLHCFGETNVHQRCPIELRPSGLFDNVDSVLDLLFHKEWVEILQENGQVLFAVPVGYDDCHPVVGCALARSVLATGKQLDGKLLLHGRKRFVRGVHFDGTICNESL